MSRQNVEDIYKLSPGQQGMLLYLVLKGYKSEVYFDQYVATLEGSLDLPAWHEAWRRIVERHAALRTLFLWDKREEPLQVVRRDAELPWQELDWSALAPGEREERFAAFLRADHAQGFDLRQAPLLRVAVIRWTAGLYKLVWSFSHLILDGWSMAIVLAEVFAAYRSLSQDWRPSSPRRARSAPSSIGCSARTWRLPSRSGAGRSPASPPPRLSPSTAPVRAARSPAGLPPSRGRHSTLRPRADSTSSPAGTR